MLLGMFGRGRIGTIFFMSWQEQFSQFVEPDWRFVNKSPEIKVRSVFDEMKLYTNRVSFCKSSNLT